MDRVVDRSIRRALSLPQDLHISDEQSLFEDLFADSLQFMSIVVEIETVYGFEFSPDAVASMSTVGDVVRETETQLRAKANPAS